MRCSLSINFNVAYIYILNTNFMEINPLMLVKVLAEVVGEVAGRTVGKGEVAGCLQRETDTSTGRRRRTRHRHCVGVCMQGT